MKKYTQLLALTLLVTGFSINGYSSKYPSSQQPGSSIECAQRSAGRTTENPGAAYKSPFEAKYLAKNPSASTVGKDKKYVPADSNSGHQQ